MDRRASSRTVETTQRANARNARRSGSGGRSTMSEVLGDVAPEAEPPFGEPRPSLMVRQNYRQPRELVYARAAAAGVLVNPGAHRRRRRSAASHHEPTPRCRTECDPGLRSGWLKEKIDAPPMSAAVGARMDPGTFAPSFSEQMPVQEHDGAMGIHDIRHQEAEEGCRRGTRSTGCRRLGSRRHGVIVGSWLELGAPDCPLEAAAP